MLKIHSIIMPFFRRDVPPLGVACLCAYFKKHNLKLNCTDFRLYKNDVQTFTYLGYQDNFVIDIPDLPLILTIIKNYQKNKPLFNGMDEIVRDYIQHRPLIYLKLKRDILEVYNIINERLPKILDNDIILFTTYDTNFFFTIMCSLLLRQKKPHITIIYGGPQVSQSENSRKLVLKLGLADVVVIGEGEKTLLDIIESYKAGKSLTIKGTMTYNKNKDIFVTKTHDILDINTLSCPDFSFLSQNGPVQNYVLPLYSSRGCIFKCNFCNEWNMWYPFRQLKPERVVEWMKKLSHDYGTFRFYFADSLLNASMPWLEEFCDKILKSRLDLQWYGYFRSKMTKELAQKLKRSGLCRAFIGAEAFSESLLERMNKKNAITHNIESIESFCFASIPLEISTVVGFPYETKSDFEKCWGIYSNLKEKYPDNILINIEPFQLRPSSNVFERFGDFGLSIKRWDSKTINMLPEISEITSRIPMSVKGKPRPQEIIRRANVMTNSFYRDPYSSKFSMRYQKEFFKKILKHVNSSNKIVFISNFRIEHIKKQMPSGKKLFVIHWEGGKYVIGEEEKMIFDEFNNRISLSEIADNLSKKLNNNIDKKKCIKKALLLLNDLLEKNFLFDILY
ncbi:MAG: radical SAM protein [Candidatus Omnitrophica bacterium]|nr:radical SAM protein [Candidatus Omnitrophota bacterium]MDD5351957.1 radical SAM protein [Candidatus Omnitrophota bacterium]MDD5550783.1 radical SAM protein [Candidatus Omnitrophota bacterium]